MQIDSSSADICPSQTYFTDLNMIGCHGIMELLIGRWKYMYIE